MVDKRPMLATPSTGAGNRLPIDIYSLLGTHTFDVKMDGIRAFAEWNGSTLVLTNRNGVDITRKFPELIEAAPDLGALPVWLDGEIVCDTGRFEDTLTRDKQNNPAHIDLMRNTHPVSFHAFDMPLYHEHIVVFRRRMLEAAVPNEGRFRIVPMSHDPEFLNQTRALGLEGVIAKLKSSTYQFGARSKAWVKFKNLHRVTCLVTGYEPGTGSRAHFGKMNLGLIDTDGQIVHCGSVGTGFTQREILDLKERLDRHEILVVEIETLNVTSGGTLRFPVYKGIRSDLEPLSCTIDQLSTLPAC